MNGAYITGLKNIITYMRNNNSLSITKYFQGQRKFCNFIESVK
jgi:hypothetical protein